MRRLRSTEGVMDKPTQRDWRTLNAAAILESENGQFGASTENAGEAIQERLREVGESLSASEESELYAALRVLRRMRAQLLTSA